MNALLILTLHSWREQLRQRFFPVAVIFGGVILYMSLLLGVLAADQELRVLLDFGLASIELLASAGVAFTAATSLLQEIETKTIYLVLTRPVHRGSYLVGRYLGVLAAALSSVLVMALIHLSLLGLKGWGWETGYLLALGGIALKLVVTAAVATLLALISTSVLSALCMTGIVWMLGHFIQEIRFLIERSSQGIAGAALQLGVYVLPNLQLLNFRDRLHVPPGISPEPLGMALLYAPLYAALCLAFTYALFRRKEF